MSNISDTYARDLDLNLLRVFAVVAEEGSITRAAARLYVTQPAVSGSMRRLSDFVGAELFMRQGRGLALTHRGTRLLAVARTHLGPLVEGVVLEPRFDPKESTARVRLGVDDGLDAVVLPLLLERLRMTAPRMKLIVTHVNCHDVEDLLLAGKVDLAVCPAEEPQRSIHREALVGPGEGMSFVCLFDQRHVKLPKAPTTAQYFAQAHVAVSYSGDGRGVVEDIIGRDRDIRLSVPGFSMIGDVVEGSSLVATLPQLLAAHIQKTRPHLRTAKLPFRLDAGTIDLLWPRTATTDQSIQFISAELRTALGARRSVRRGQASSSSDLSPRRPRARAFL